MAKKYIDAKWHYPQEGEYPVIYGEYERKHYPQIPCLVFHHGMYGVRFWNCTEECWDDEEGDDFYCLKEEVEKWMYIDSLEQEQPSEDLKVEIREWVNLMVGASFPEQDGDFISEEDYRSVIRQTAIHFYELGKHGKEPVTEDLEEEIKRYIPRDKCPVPDFMEAVARHFAEWQKEQMLKDAVEGYVNYYEDSGGILMAEAQVGCPYHNGDKVKIVIISDKEDKE